MTPLGNEAIGSLKKRAGFQSIGKFLFVGLFCIVSITINIKLSLRTAMALFRVKLQLVISYGLDLIWEHLSASNLQCIEKVKATYLKRVLCLSKYTRSRLVYEMCRELSLLEELGLNLLLPSTSAYEEAIRIHEGKKTEIWRDFYATDAMTGKEWAEANYDCDTLSQDTQLMASTTSSAG